MALSCPYFMKLLHAAVAYLQWLQTGNHNSKIYIYIYMHIYTYIYTYIYIKTNFNEICAINITLNFFLSFSSFFTCRIHGIECKRPWLNFRFLGKQAVFINGDNSSGNPL